MKGPKGFNRSVLPVAHTTKSLQMRVESVPTADQHRLAQQSSSKQCVCSWLSSHAVEAVDIQASPHNQYMRNACTIRAFICHQLMAQGQLFSCLSVCLSVCLCKRDSVRQRAVAYQPFIAAGKVEYWYTSPLITSTLFVYKSEFCKQLLSILI